MPEEGSALATNTDIEQCADQPSRKVQVKLDAPGAVRPDLTKAIARPPQSGAPPATFGSSPPPSATDCVVLAHREAGQPGPARKVPGSGALRRAAAGGGRGAGAPGCTTAPPPNA